MAQGKTTTPKMSRHTCRPNKRCASLDSSYKPESNIGSVHRPLDRHSIPYLAFFLLTPPSPGLFLRCSAASITLNNVVMTMRL